jgi:uncharacterized protein YndB with AHSA1/START domain
MSTKVLAPQYLRLEREIASSESIIWHALTDLHELRAWWGMPIVELNGGVGGRYDVHYVGRSRIDRFVYTTWLENWKIGGTWLYNWLEGSVQEMITIVRAGEGARVTIEQSGFESFDKHAARLFGYHKIESSGRLERLQAWCEKGVPANMAQMPVV